MTISAGLLALALPSFLGGAQVETPPAPSPALAATAEERAVHAVLLERFKAAEHLPLAFAGQALDGLVVRWHRNPAYALAFVVPAEVSERPEPSKHDGAAGPQERPPRGILFLYRPAYAAGGLPKPIAELPVDAAEYLFHALLGVWLERELPEREPALETRFAARAEEVMAAVPPEQREAAYREALASFGAHALAVANQLEASARHHRERGSDLCRHLERPGTLFALWDAVFGGGQYLGRYYLPAPPPAPPEEPPGGEAPQRPAAPFPPPAGRWVESGISIEKSDKLLFAEHVFGGFWTGERERDLERRYCPAQP